MGICCRRNNNKSDGPTSMQEGEPQNPFKPNNRKCTDMLCSLVFILFWIGMIIIAGIGYAHGEPKRLVYGTDWKGRTCGVKSTSAKGNVPAYDFTNYPYLLYPRLAEDMVALYGGNLSTAELLDSSNLAKFYGVCVTKCPMLNDSTNPLYIHAYQDYTTQKEPVNNEYFVLDATKEDENAGSPWRLMMDTTEVLYRCVELSKIDVVQTARCVDECTPGELVNVNLTCGRDYDRNPMVECGEKDCTEVILAFRSNCTSIERTRQENQVTSSRTDPITNMMGQDWYMVARWMGDVQKAALPILICGGLFALLLGFLWLVFLRYCAGLFVWLAILSVAIMQGVITLFCAFEGGLLTSSKVTAAMTEMGVSSTTLTSALTNSTNYVNASGFQVTQDQQYYWAIACYVMIAVDVALFLVLIFMCGRIRIAIGIIREASKALQAMPSMVLYPILPTLFATGLVAYWVVAAAYITTSANLSAADVTTAVAKTGFTPPPIAVEMKSDRIINYLLIYHLFGLLWTSQFIQAIAYTTLAGCFCEYYWTMDKRQVKGFVVGRSMYRTVRYHFGTMAFGSLIIAIVQMVRLGLEYIDQQMKSTKQGNTFVKIVMLCLKCCLWCFEKVVKFLNANAYIMVAMKGSSFCPAMKDSFLLLFTNAARVATVSIITRFLMMMGKVFIAAFCMFFMFLFIRHPPSNLPTFFMGSLDHISSPIFPMLITGLLGYTVASFFLDVYGTGIDTILLCFCEDCKVNKGSDKYYMSDELFAFIDGPAKKNAFKVYQPTRDVSSRDRPEELQPVTVAPIYATSPPVGKRS